MMPRAVRILGITTPTTSMEESADPPEAVNVESDFVVILAALLCAFVCVVGLIAVARCTWVRRTVASDGPSASSSANKGLKKKIVQSLPKFTYTGTMQVQVSARFASLECSICLGEYAEGEEIRILPQCGHGFHVGCIDIWLSAHSSCPSCRQILVVSRCHKCGEFAAASAAPSTSSSSCHVSTNVAELKASSEAYDPNRDQLPRSSSFLP